MVVNPVGQMSVYEVTMTVVVPALEFGVGVTEGMAVMTEVMADEEVSASCGLVDVSYPGEVDWLETGSVLVAKEALLDWLEETLVTPEDGVAMLDVAAKLELNSCVDGQGVKLGMLIGIDTVP